MNDIVKAIEKEKEYLEYRMKGEEPFHLVDAIKECGFESLNDYFKAKRDYEFKSMEFNFVETSTLTSITEVLKAIALKKPTVVMVDIDRTVIFPRKDAEYNKEYCITNSIPILPVQANGNGTLVSTNGDLGVGICVPKINGITYEYILDGFINIFRKYTDKTVKNEGNDIMIDGKKVCGFAFYETNHIIMAITPISLSDKTELIKNICLKKQQKTPGYIDFMSRDIIRREVSEWLGIST